jgi:hypothetical protein
MIAAPFVGFLDQGHLSLTSYSAITSPLVSMHSMIALSLVVFWIRVMDNLQPIPPLPPC